MRLAGLAVVALGGCLPLDPFRTESEFAQVPTSPFAPSVVQTVKRANPNFAPATSDVGLRVDAVSRKLLAANAQTGLKPMFATVGSPAPEMFHPDQSMVYVTEGLVRQCKSEAELAAVLAFELGRMVSEREAAASRDARTTEPRLPMPLPIGNQGDSYAADPSYYFEMARFEKEHPRSARTKILPPPDPRLIAGTLLEQAGYHKTDLDAVTPILRSAEKNFILERQYKGISDSGTTWRAQ
jgi:hypothetical protein